LAHAVIPTDVVILALGLIALRAVVVSGFIPLLGRSDGDGGVSDCGAAECGRRGDGDRSYEFQRWHASTSPMAEIFRPMAHRIQHFHNTCPGMTSGTLTSQSPRAACIHASWHARAFKIRRRADQPHEQAAWKLPIPVR
jgi:hypothetical protein